MDSTAFYSRVAVTAEWPRRRNVGKFFVSFDEPTFFWPRKGVCAKSPVVLFTNRATRFLRFGPVQNPSCFSYISSSRGYTERNQRMVRTYCTPASGLTANFSICTPNCVRVLVTKPIVIRPRPRSRNSFLQRTKRVG